MHYLRRCLLLTGLLFALFIMLPLPSVAQVSVRIALPAPYRFTGPPSVVVIPGTYVYTVPDIGEEIFFFSGSWYRPYEGRWFRASSYNGPWVYCPDPKVPRALVELPPDHRAVPPGYRRIPYGELKKNWAGWERGRYWDKDRDWKAGWHGTPEERREGRPEEERGRDFERGEHRHGD